MKKESTAWVIPVTLYPKLTFVPNGRYAKFGTTVHPRCALHCKSKDDAIDERDFMNNFRKPNEKLNLEPILIVL